MSAWSNNVAASLQTVESSLEDANKFFLQIITRSSKGKVEKSKEMYRSGTSNFIPEL
jgi:hypothetical protein